jgi:RNA polymerase-binding transcription factor DksA
MHYHYFTLEQRDALTQSMKANFEGEPLQKALERLREPDFGVCAACGRDIPFVRLQENPAAIHCRGCAPNPG